MARAPRSKPAAAATTAATATKKEKKSSTSTSTTTTATATAPASTATSTVKGKAKAASTQAQTQTQTQQLIDRRVSPAQALKAINALIAHREKRTAASSSSSSSAGADQLLPNTPTARDDTLFLQLSLKRLAAPSSSSPFPKPAQIPLPHALLSPESASVCLIVKDPQREYKDLLTSLNIRSIARIVGVTKLKGKFAPFDARRQLMNDHDLFLVDERVVGLMPRLLGKKWMESKKPPIPVKITHTRHLAAELDRAIGATYYLPTRGSCLTVRIGSLVAHTPTQLVDNLEAALPAIVQRLKPIDSDAGDKHEAPGTRSRWNNIQAIELKTGSSMALPIWNSSLVERWVGMDEESAKAKEIREAQAVKRAAKKAKLEEKKQRKLLKGAAAVEEAMEDDSDDDEDDDEDAEVADGQDDSDEDEE
ncbi:proteasome-interacting protein cic1 [Tilletia horrida]|nr:proteasome-interacting protein cic1 [Tilletia horrida]